MEFDASGTRLKSKTRLDVTVPPCQLKYGTNDRGNVGVFGKMQTKSVNQIDTFRRETLIQLNET